MKRVYKLSLLNFIKRVLKELDEKSDEKSDENLLKEELLKNFFGSKRFKLIRSSLESKL